MVLTDYRKTIKLRVSPRWRLKRRAINMKTRIEYDPTQYPERVNLLIMLKAEQWQCPPSEALARLLDELAEENLTQAAA